MESVKMESNVLDPTFIQLLGAYEKELQYDPSNYGMLLECQTYSHIALMRCIVSIMSFEVYKRRGNCILDLEGYTVPNKIATIYRQFNSLSYKARRAMQGVYKYYYSEVVHLKKDCLFDHTINYEGFKKFANAYAQ